MFSGHLTLKFKVEIATMSTINDHTVSSYSAMQTLVPLFNEPVYISRLLQFQLSSDSGLCYYFDFHMWLIGRLF